MVITNRMVSWQNPYSKTCALHDYAERSENARFIVVFIATTVLIPVMTILIDVTVRNAIRDRRKAWCSPSRIPCRVSGRSTPSLQMPEQFDASCGQSNLMPLALQCLHQQYSSRTVVPEYSHQEVSAAHSMNQLMDTYVVKDALQPY